MAPQSRGASGEPERPRSSRMPPPLVFSSFSMQSPVRENSLELPQASPTYTTTEDFSHANGVSYDPDEPADTEQDDADFESRYFLDDQSSDSYYSDDEKDANRADRSSSLHRSNSSLLGANAFAPPFYNRPPTPLPPSPSLSSLLRPSFSATTSRPTTPDTSDNETPNDTEAVVAKSARTATTVPRASPKVPTYEYYGFVLYISSSFAFVIYLLWSYLPSPFLHQLGIYYYPNRWWSLAIPSYLVMTIVYIYVALASYNTGYLTLPMDSIENIVDEAANIAVIDSKGRIRKGGSEKLKNHTAAMYNLSNSHKKLDWKNVWSEGTDAVMDIPVGGVCEILYGGDCKDKNEEIGTFNVDD